MKKILLLITLFTASLCFGQNTETKVLDVTIKTKKGKLAGILTIPPYEAGEKIPVAILCHGFTSNKDAALIRDIADSLCAHKIASVRFDFNGHGSSYGRQEDMTVPLQIQDAIGAYNFATRFPYRSKIALVGHSQGGVVAAMAAAELGAENVPALALISPAAVLRDDALRGILADAKYDAIRPPQAVSVHNGTYTIGRNYILTAQNLPIYETAKNYKGKTLIVQGKADVVVPYTYAQRFNEVIEGSRLELIDKLDHSYTNHTQIPAHLVAQFIAEVLK